ncbi:toxin-antitoxin system YwqK family antitoxin [bacterium SCSIO 12741]|nr:toxin-antitoxin system YwqK family antitoxin [bacterium SCSIO 12741]
MNKTMLSLSKNLAVIFLVVAFFSCSEKTEKISEIYPNGKTKVLTTVDSDQRVVAKKEFYINGKVKIEGSFDGAGERQGLWTYYYEDGKVWSRCEYTAGLRDGKNEVYYENGKLRYSGSFKNDEKTGEWTFFDEEGQLIKKVNF